MKNYFLFAFAFLLFACGKDDDELQALATLIDNETIFISAAASSDFINIQIEALVDSSNQTLGTFPNSDFCSVIFDINANASIDENIDFGYSSQTINYDLCDFYLIDSTTVSACGALTSQANFTADFSDTERSNTEHVFWNLQIPKEELNNQQSIYFRIKTYNNGVYRNYPEGRISENNGSFSFEDTYRLDL